MNYLLTKRKVLLMLIWISFVLFTALFSCKDNPVDPYANLEPGRRDYEWTVDTLFIPFTYLERIWGSSPNDVWAIGQGGDKDKIIYHYDGNKWSNDGKSRPAAPFAIWGFGPDDVWIGGYGPLFHYDGNDWQKDFEYINPSLTRYGIMDIWGDSPNNVWAVGFADSSNVRKGIIFNYNGVSWRRVDIGFNRSTMMRIKRGKKTSNNYFIWGLKESDIDGDTTKLFEFDGKRLKEIYSSFYGRYNWNYIQEIDDEIILMIDNRLFFYNEGHFEKYIDNNSNNTMDGFWGRSRKDIFWLMFDGVMHYNGSNIKYIINSTPDIRFREAVIFKDQVFFLANSFSKSESIIFKGILKN